MCRVACFISSSLNSYFANTRCARARLPLNSRVQRHFPLLVVMYSVTGTDVATPRCALEVCVARNSFSGVKTSQKVRRRQPSPPVLLHTCDSHRMFRLMGALVEKHDSVWDFPSGIPCCLGRAALAFYCGGAPCMYRNRPQ